jgi:hypothetical protein
MLNILKLFAVVHQAIDKVEVGETGTLTSKIGTVNFKIDITETTFIDSGDYVIGHTETNKIWGIFLDVLLSAFAGAPMVQDWVIDCTKQGDPHYLHMAVSATL